MKRYYKAGVKLAILFVIGGAVAYYLFFSPLPVESAKVTKGTVVAEAMGTGTLEARIHATISPKISGLIAQVLVDQNDKVVKGQTLFILDDKDLRQQVDMAKADLAAVQASAEKAMAQIQSAQATEKKAKLDLTRMSSLKSSGSVSVDAFEKAQQQRGVAQAELNQAQAARIEAEKLVAKAQASLRYSQARLVDTVVCAPFDGLIIKRYKDPGGIAVPGSMVLDMISLNQLWISAWVDETLLDQLKFGQASKIVFRSDPKAELPGKVARIAPQADRETREVLVDVAIDRLPAKWAIGQRADVYIETAHKENATVIPQRVIVWRQGQPGVFVIDKGRAYWHKVVLGIEGKDKVEVAEGLQPGQIVLIPGSSLPKDGRAVKVMTK
ncbi:MAG: efflux RND transporter periplasmic adaptor subunit [Phycisphaerae bacterium]